MTIRSFISLLLILVFASAGVASLICETSCAMGGQHHHGDAGTAAIAFAMDADMDMSGDMSVKPGSTYVADSGAATIARLTADACLSSPTECMLSYSSDARPVDDYRLLHADSVAFAATNKTTVTLVHAFRADKSVDRMRPIARRIAPALRI